MKWIELYCALGVIGSILGIIAMIGLVLYVVITKKKPF